MCKKRTRFVMIDTGYDLNECWLRVKVIKSETTNLFGGGERKSLLIEEPSGERYWVNYWEEENV